MKINLNSRIVFCDKIIKKMTKRRTNGEKNEENEGKNIKNRTK